MSQTSNKERQVVRLIERIERIVYYGAALFLLVTIGFVFFSAAEGFLEITEIGALQVSPEVLDRVLLIFAELLETV